MRKLLAVVAFALVAAVGADRAHAGFVIEGSVGKGITLNQGAGDATATNVMLAPGYELLGLVRLQLGLVGQLADVEQSKFDLQLRPMIGFYPPILPIYGRLIFAVTNLLGENGDTKVATGGAVGLKFGIPMTPLGVFAEAGVLPFFDVANSTLWVLEGRLGAFLAF